MDTQFYLVAVAAFILATALGFAAHQEFQPSEEKYFSKEVSIRVDSGTQIDSAEFDNHSIELRYEDTDRAKFYYKFNDLRGVQQIEDLQHDGSLQTFRDIKSFGNETYFLYIRYLDDSNQSEDGWMELYRIEGT